MTNKNLWQLTRDEEALQAEISGLMEDEDQEGANEQFKLLIDNQCATDQKIGRMLRVIANYEHIANVCEVEYKSAKAIIERFKKRSKSATNVIDRIKSLILEHMQSTGKKEIEIDEGKIILCDNGGKPTITKPKLMTDTDWNRVDEKFYEMHFEWSNDAILTAHADGEPLPKDVEVTRGQHVRIS